MQVPGDEVIIQAFTGEQENLVHTGFLGMWKLAEKYHMLSNTRFYSNIQ